MASSQEVLKHRQEESCRPPYKSQPPVPVQVLDLVNLTAACKGLRSLASADHLWARLCQDDFRVDRWDEEDAGRWGWMRVYKMKHVQQQLAR